MAITCRRIWPPASTICTTRRATTVMRSHTIRTMHNLLARAFLYTAASGDVRDAAKLAKRVVAANPRDRAARLALTVDDLAGAIMPARECSSRNPRAGRSSR